MFYILLLLLNMNSYSMDRQHGSAMVSIVGNSPFELREPSGSESEEDDLCEVAMARYRNQNFDFSKYIKPHLRNLLQEVHESPHLNRHESNAEILRRIRSGEDQYENSEQRIHEMVMRAMYQSFEERDQMISSREARIREKYSGKKTAIIATITGTLSTIVTTICATLITISAK